MFIDWVGYSLFACMFSWLRQNPTNNIQQTKIDSSSLSRARSLYIPCTANTICRLINIYIYLHHFYDLDLPFLHCKSYSILFVVVCCWVFTWFFFLLLLFSSFFPCFVCLLTLSLSSLDSVFVFTNHIHVNSTMWKYPLEWMCTPQHLMVLQLNSVCTEGL